MVLTNSVDRAHTLVELGLIIGTETFRVVKSALSESRQLAFTKWIFIVL